VSVTRVCVLLAAMLVTLLSVVMLREETTQIHYRLSQLDAREQSLRQGIWEKELELARLRNPMLIRARLKDLRVPDAAPTEPPAVPRKARTRRTSGE
jgi:hypothetical protein